MEPFPVFERLRLFISFPFLSIHLFNITVINVYGSINIPIITKFYSSFNNISSSSIPPPFTVKQVQILLISVYILIFQIFSPKITSQNLGPILQSKSQKMENQERPTETQKFKPESETKQLQVISQPQPRIMINKIILQNFKSYAGRQVIGPFHENFTSIVGPNGSGKSNLIESMLFIFGYNASWMRMSRVSQLIHHSSTNNNLTKASVEVHFKKVKNDQGDRTQRLPGELILKRTVNSSGVSKYEINGKESTQSEVRQTLKRQGIDLCNNRFLILQGEVEQISQMKPKSGDREKPGLIQYLEDIIGSNIYIDEIEKGLQQYMQNQEQKHEKGELMKIFEGDLRLMEDSKNEGVFYLKSQMTFHQCQNILFQIQMSQEKQTIDILVGEQKELEKQRQKIVKEEKQKLEKQANRIRQIKKNRQEIDKKQKEVDMNKDFMDKLNYADKNIVQQIKFKSEDQVKYEQKIHLIEAQTTKLMEESTELQQQIQDLPLQTQELNEEIHTLGSFLHRYEKPHLKTKISELQTAMKKNELQVKSSRNQLKVKNKQYEEICSSGQISVDEIATLQLSVLEKDEQIVQLQKQQNQELRKIKELNLECDQHHKHRSSINSEIIKLETSIRQLQDETKNCEENQSMFSLIMKQNIPGVLGRLGDLATIPQEYDEIITSCFGSRLDNIVTRNYQAAQQVIKYLKQTKLGRVSCIILDTIKQHSNYMRRNWQNLPHTIRLFDLINPTVEDVRVAFYFVMNDTIYCENSDLGMSYAMQDSTRRKVISKKQNGFIVFEISGLMYGCRRKKGGFSTKTKKSVESVKREIVILEQKKEIQEDRMKEVEMSIGENRKQNKQNQLKQEKIRKEKQFIQREKDRLVDEINDLKRSCLRKSEEEIRKQKVALEQEVNRIQMKITALEDQSEALKEEIQETEAEQRQTESEQINQKRERYKELKEQFQKHQKDSNLMLAKLQKVPEQIKDLQKSKKNFEGKLKFLREDIEKLKRQQERIEKKATEIYALITEGDDKVSQLKQYDQQLCIILEEDVKEVKDSKQKIQTARAKVQENKKLINKGKNNYANNQLKLKHSHSSFEHLQEQFPMITNLQAIERMKLGRNSQNHDPMDHIEKANQIRFPKSEFNSIKPNAFIDEQILQKFIIFKDHLQQMMNEANANIQQATTVNATILKTYVSKFIQYEKKKQQIQLLGQQLAGLKQKITCLKHKRLSKFRQGFSVINGKLQEVYQLLTKGGNAELQLLDTLDPFSEGINFTVRPVRKTWKEINKLSGGQKTLSSLSLIFALHYYKPTPLYFMDEIDAALDYRNVSVVAEYIKKRTRNAQFIIISLRNNMFDEANRLIGVYKIKDMTKIINWNPPLEGQK